MTGASAARPGPAPVPVPVGGVVADVSGAGTTDSFLGRVLGHGPPATLSAHPEEGA
ncbi:hypothetical protein GCM10010206_18400 [Streptomyces cinerochromogenes]|nr:hypothetical protein GCM10010206_18400 [Streptomyces cinerochromogenes]